MKLFLTREVPAAVAHAAAGGQSLHVHAVVFPHSPRCFRDAVARGEPIAHLFDLDRARLLATAKQLGVKVLFVDRDGTGRQHVDLCAGPLRRAYLMLDESDRERVKAALILFKQAKENDREAN